MIKLRRFSRFDDPALNPAEWQALLGPHQRDLVFLTWEWQAAWWDAFGRGDLLLLAVEEEGRLKAIAPLFADSGMVYFVGSGGSDYLDFVGAIDDGSVLEQLLSAARGLVPGFLGFRFYHLPEWSPTARQLERIAARAGMDLVDEGDLAAPAIRLDTEPGLASRLASKASLLRHERWFAREGLLSVEHLDRPAAIRIHLDALFDQHIRRWAATPHPSLFNEERQRRFYVRILDRAEQGAASWLRFCRVIWNGRAVACHLGFHLGGRFLWYKPTFEIDLARRSPGEVLLRNLILRAESESARVFDFGLGEEPFKNRFANHVARVRTWGLYPAGTGAGFRPDRAP
jgi:CelD/BcsL family acetyltransferase involved in cellulose biosynthesis